MKVCLVIPTYNEKENIQKLLDKILIVSKKVKKHKIDILILDDNSPDGTEIVVEKYMKIHKNIHLLKGKKEGLGKAYLRGFTHVLEKYNFDAVFMMDADLSHDPEEIPNFLRELDSGYDFVIGSRYVEGGDIPDWDFKRRLVSRVGNMFARLVGGMYNVKDCTTGYRAIKTTLLKKIDLSNLHTKGYAFLSTLLFECIHGGAKIKEIPIIFRDRQFGETKLKTKDMVEFFINAFRLRMKTSRRFIKFIIVGASGVFVNLGSLFMLVEKFGLDKKIVAPSISLELSILWNFVLNNYWTFKKSKNNDHTLVKLLKFNLIALVGFGINLLIYNKLLSSGIFAFVGRYDYLASQFVAIAVVTLWNYFVNKNWTWR